MDTDQATPEAVCSTAMLGQMVERIGSPPDTHCWDDDSAADCWSYSAQMVAELLDAAVAAERERCAKLCEEVESQAWALWKTTADPIEQGRNIGAQHCADAIRA